MAFNTPSGETVARELLVAYLNTGSAESPVWSPVGKRVEDSSVEFDFSVESKTDIFGKTYTNAKKPVVTQTFDPCELDSEDSAQYMIWEKAVKDQDYASLCNMDMLIVHAYADFAERYSSCAVIPTSLGGEGGGSIGMPIDVTYGGTRTKGTVTKSSSGAIEFVPDVA